MIVDRSLDNKPLRKWVNLQHEVTVTDSKGLLSPHNVVKDLQVMRYINCRILLIKEENITYYLRLIARPAT